jgi:HD domain
VVDQTERPARIAEQQLAKALPRRWVHVQAVGVKAERISRVLNPVDGRDLVVAAWLHDIGYAPALVDTGLHALDGGRWLLRNGWPTRIASLVAHHSCALFEADERGLGEQLRGEFELEESPTADALWFADMTTGPNGEDLDVLDRLAEIRRRYGPDDPVSRFWLRAKPTLVQAVRRTEALLAAQPM